MTDGKGDTLARLVQAGERDGNARASGCAGVGPKNGRAMRRHRACTAIATRIASHALMNQRRGSGLESDGTGTRRIDGDAQREGLVRRNAHSDGSAVRICTVGQSVTVVVDPVEAELDGAGVTGGIRCVSSCVNGSTARAFPPAAYAARGTSPGSGCAQPSASTTAQASASTTALTAADGPAGTTSGQRATGTRWADGTSATGAFATPGAKMSGRTPSTEDTTASDRPTRAATGVRACLPADGSIASEVGGGVFASELLATKVSASEKEREQEGGSQKAFLHRYSSTLSSCQNRKAQVAPVVANMGAQPKDDAVVDRPPSSF